MNFKKKRSVLYILIALTIQHSSAQRTKPLPLKVGDIVPEIALGRMINPEAHDRSISDYKGRLLILDFWSVHCADCINAFPKMESLQTKFGEKLAIVPVGFEYREGDVTSFLEKQKRLGYFYGLPMAVQHPKDSLLYAYFPFIGLPHEIWIGKDGTVIGITNQLAVDSSDIAAILSDKTLNFSVKGIPRFINSVYDDFLINIKRNTPFPYGSAYSGYVDGIRTMSPFGGNEASDSIWSFFSLNQPVTYYYIASYAHANPWLEGAAGRKRVIVEPNGKPFYKDGHDAGTMNYWEYQEYARDNLFCFEAILPKSMPLDSAYTRVIQDLDRFFQISSSIERRRIRCYALRRTSAVDKLKSRGISDFYVDKEENIIMKNWTMSEVVKQHLNQVLGNAELIIDETNYHGKVDITLPRKANSIPLMREALQKYDLDLGATDIEMEVLILRNSR